MPAGGEKKYPRRRMIRLTEETDDRLVEKSKTKKKAPAVLAREIIEKDVLKKKNATN